MTKKEKQIMIPGVSCVEMKHLQVDIENINQNIADLVSQLIEIDSVESKKNSIKTLRLLEAGIKGLIYLRNNSECQGLVTMNRGIIGKNEKTRVRAKAKKQKRDDKGVVERFANEVRLHEEITKQIDWESYYDSDDEVSPKRKDIDG